MLDAPGDRLDETGGFPDELPSSNHWGDPSDRLRNDTIRHRCKKQPTAGKRIRWNRLRWFGHVCRMDDPVCQNASYGQNVQTIGVVLPMHRRNNGKTRSLPTPRRNSPGASTVTPCRATAADMTAERGAWRGLRYDITGIKRRRDDSSERAHPDATSVDG